MSDKSPRQNKSKKSEKSLKEKRRERKDKAGGQASDMEKLTTAKGRRNG